MAIDDNANYTLTGAQVKDLASEINAKEDSANLATVATTGAYSDLSGTPSLATVATSGSYDDLSNKPTIPAAQIQSNWTQTTTTAVDYIKNKPTIPTVNNATLTIQKNGTDVQTFSANQSTNATANITVPTQFSDLTGTIDTSQIANGAVTNAKTSATVIFNTANTSGNVTLLDNVTNYDYIDIYGHEIGSRKVHMRLTAPTIGNKFSFYCLFIGSSNTTLYWRGKTFEITDATTLTVTSDSAQVEIKASGNTVTGGGTNVYIDKIIGYK